MNYMYHLDIILELYLYMLVFMDNHLDFIYKYYHNIYKEHQLNK